MLRSHFKLAYRHLLKNKVFSLINIAGLAVSIAAAFLIVQYLTFEMGYDRFHGNKDEIFRVTYQQHENGEVRNTSAGTFYGVGTFMKEYFHEVENVVRFYKWPASTGVLLMTEGKIYNERNYFFSEPDFFRVFSSLLVQGDAATCLLNPNSMVISRRFAEKMFGTTDVIGRAVIDLDRKNQEIIVTGIMKDIPDNSHFDLDIVRPAEKAWNPEGTQWKYFREWTYFTLKKGTSVSDFEKRLNDALNKAQNDNPYYRGVSMSLQRITDIHLKSHLKSEIKPNGNISLIYILGAVFIIILIIAWINYINLETARFITRIREVGVRRIVGSLKRELVLQFFIQYLCICLISSFLACFIIIGIWPYYQLITGVTMQGVEWSNSWLMGTSLGIFLTGTLVTAVYPGLLLTKLNLVACLKGNASENIRGAFIRKSLLIFQFVSSLLLIGSLLVISRQLHFMRTANGNVTLAQILTVYNPTNYSAYEDSLRMERNAVFREKLLQNRSILNLTTSSAIPGEPVGFTYVDLAKRSLNDPDKQIPYKVIYIDYDFIPVYGLGLIAGRNYSVDRGEDEHWQALVVTESTIRELGFASAQEAIDKEIYFMEADWGKWRIIGVVEDYRHESVKSPIYPTIFRLHRNKGQMVYYSMTVNPTSAPEEVVDAAENAWKETWPEKPFEYFFLDEYYDRQFKSEAQFASLFAFFSGIAIFIACLGILGMTLLETNARLKEISIRKVLGASVTSLLALLSRDHIRVISISVLLAIPLIWLTAEEWLSSYPSRIEISWEFFLIPTFVIVVMVAITSSFKTWKATTTNPVNHLRNE
ncbi:MAG: ABC transporter permease [Cyclobacteriaceae bacterium]